MQILANKWVDYYMCMAEVAATGSKDGSTKVGAIVVRPDKSIAATGFNGFPKSVPDDFAILNEPEHRATKLKLIVHAEENAMRFCKEDMTGYSIFVTHKPCPICMKAIVREGISNVYYKYNEGFENSSWAESLKDTDYIAKVGNVTMLPVKMI